MIRIAVDMMGSDLGISPIIEAFYYFTKKYSDIYFVLVGDKLQIHKYLKKYKINTKFYKIINTTEIILMSDGPIAIRQKKDSSMLKSAELLKNNLVDAFVSSGSTAVFLAICHFIIGKIKGIQCPGFMSFIPTIKKYKNIIMIDVGANLNNNAQDLLNFAIMATIYAKFILKFVNPSVGLLNIGEEAIKGKTMHQETYKLLNKNTQINFIGNIESRDITSNKADIIVCDGFTGNMVLKAIEGMAKNLIYIFQKEFTKNIFRKFKLLFLYSILKKIKKNFDYRNNASALMLGIKKIAVKTHGSSDKKSWISAFEMLRMAVINNFITKIEKIIK